MLLFKDEGKKVSLLLSLLSILSIVYMYRRCDPDFLFGKTREA